MTYFGLAPWLFWSLLSAVFAALTAVLAKAILADAGATELVAFDALR